MGILGRYDDATDQLVPAARGQVWRYDDSSDSQGGSPSDSS